MTKGSVEELHLERFISRYGVLLEEDGLPRTASQMIALMSVHKGPFSFSELAERLQVSRGSVSTNTRLLERMGVIERITRTGDRQDYFQATGDPGLRMIESWLNRQQKKVQMAEEFLGDENTPDNAKPGVQGMVEVLKATTASARRMIALLKRQQDRAGSA